MNVIREALAQLPGRWYKGGVRDGHGNYCGIGHLRDVCGVMSVENAILFANSEIGHAYDKALLIMHEVAREQYPDRMAYYDGSLASFAAFNDHPDTTEAEVIAVMEKAAARLDEQV